MSLDCDDEDDTDYVQVMQMMPFSWPKYTSQLETTRVLKVSSLSTILSNTAPHADIWLLIARSSWTSVMQL